MFNCDLCDKTFICKSKLNEHKNRKNPCNKVKESNKCDLCSIEFPCLAKLERHNKTKRHINIVNQYINDNRVTDIKTENIETENINQNELKLREEIELLKKDKEILENTIKNNEIIKYKTKEENINNIEDNELQLKQIFDEITTHKSLNNINLSLIIKCYYQLLTIQELLFVINYNVNNLYIDKFWNNIEDDKWIYLDNDLIDWFGYKDIIRGKEQLVKIIKREFEIDEDYKIYTNEEFLNSDFISGLKPELKFNNNFKHIILKPDCFKLTCMQVGTSKSKDIYKYFLEIEKIFKFYNKYILKYNQVKLEKTRLIKNTYIDRSLIQSKEWLYLISNSAKARENIFKFGFTTSKQARLSTYNTGSVEGDRFFYCELYECYNARSLEKRVENLLKNFKIPNESEMYQLNFKAFDMLLKTICSNDNESVNSINTFLVNDYDKYLNLDPIEFNFEEN
jgi:hypothetical protein